MVIKDPQHTKCTILTKVSSACNIHEILILKTISFLVITTITLAIIGVDERYKVTSGGARTCPSANNQAKFACFDVTSRVDIGCARSSLCQAR